MSTHAFLPGLFSASGGLVAILINVVGRAWRRAIILIFSLLLIGVGVGAPYLVSVPAFASAIGWMLAGVGAIFLLVAGPGWPHFEPVKQDEADSVLKLATGRPPRHFGEAP